MKRIWFTGSAWRGHPAMPGIVLVTGSAVDVPEDLAKSLVASGEFAEEAPAKVPAISGPWPGASEVVLPFTEIASSAMTQARPKTLTEISGLGPFAEEKLAAYGITTVDDLAGLEDSLMEEIADKTPGISKSLLRRWRLSAS